MKKNLPNKKTITIKPAEVIEIDSITIERFIDNPKRKFVKVFIDELREPLTLWENESYDSIGNWTKKQANDRILELIDNM